LGGGADDGTGADVPRWSTVEGGGPVPSRLSWSGSTTAGPCDVPAPPIAAGPHRSLRGRRADAMIYIIYMYICNHPV
jgi:hypothetical protein